jgi:hypothetical protein
MIRLPLVLLVLAACDAPDAPDAPDPPGSTPEAATLAALSSAPADDVLGTIEATVDGQAMTWYVLSGSVRGAPYASAVWYRPDDESVLIGLGGFDTRTPPLETFEMGEGGATVSYGDYAGPVLSLMLETGPDPAPYRRTLPGDDMTTFVFMPEATTTDVSLMFILNAGVVDVTVLELSGGTVRAEGTFSGRIGNVGGGGRAMEVTDGRFSVRGIPHLDEISGG